MHFKGFCVVFFVFLGVFGLFFDGFASMSQWWGLSELSGHVLNEPPHRSCFLLHAIPLKHDLLKGSEFHPRHSIDGQDRMPPGQLQKNLSRMFDYFSRYAEESKS